MIGAVVLAAGQGTRYAAASGGAIKLLSLYQGQALVRIVVDAALASQARPVVVVTGHARDAVTSALAGLLIEEVCNPDYADGLSTSLRVGIAALPDTVAGALVLLADMPQVTPHLIDRMIAEASRHTDFAAVVPTVDGRRGNPVLLGARLFATVTTLTGDEGARKLLHSVPDVYEMQVDDVGVLLDVDTPNALPTR